ncbi:MAG: hypothetical protein II997_04015 [Clostridia bacterium]|nr:hypothetical protein [Clostridia bacterium]
MTRKQKEQLSNRLVMNFGILLAAGLILLYVNSALRSGIRISNPTYLIILILGIISLALGVYVFVLGKIKKPKLTNYSAIFFGTFISCAVLYVSKFGWIPGFDKMTAVIPVYILMAVYFIVLSIVTAIQLRKPLVKSESEKIQHKKKKK